MTIEEFISRNQKLCDKASKGPWRCGDLFTQRAGINPKMPVFPAEGRRKVCTVQNSGIDRCGASEQKVKDNAEFIANSRQAVPVLLKILRELTRVTDFDDKSSTLITSDAIRNSQIAEQIINEELAGKRG